MGVSTFKDKTKIRFANDSMRIKTLKRNGHIDIDFITLPEPMTKADSIKYLRSIDWCGGASGVQDAMDLILYRNPAGPDDEQEQLELELH